MRRRMKTRALAATAAGFSLLEVMVALAILGISLTALSRSQINSIRAASHSKLMTVAVMLARGKMVEVEDTLFEEGFSDFEEEEEGDFEEEGFKRYSYVLKVDKVELPTATDAEAMMGAAKEEAGGEEGEGGPGAMMQMGAQLMSTMFELIRNVIERSIRRVQLKVTWKEGSRERNVSVVGYFTDPRIVDAAAGGSLEMPGQEGQVNAEGTETGQGTTPGTSTGTSPTNRQPTRNLPVPRPRAVP